MSQITTTLYRNIEGTQLEVEFAVEVEYTYYKASGDGWNEPHEDAYIEIEGVTGRYKSAQDIIANQPGQEDEITLTKEEEEKIYSEIEKSGDI